MSHALVFYTQSCTREVVSISAIPPGATCGDVVRARCLNGRHYKAKVLYIGAKEICEMKSPKVTEDGLLLEDDFDITALSDFDDDEDEPVLEERRAPEVLTSKEVTTRLIKIEDMLTILIDSEKKRSEEHERLTQSHQRQEVVQREMLRRMPTIQAQGEISYVYTTAKSVAQIRQLKGLNMSHFALALEAEVYKDNTSELELLVDKRIRTKDRILFVQQCLYKYYDIPAHLRDGSWRKVKEALNSRVRRLRKTIRDRRSIRATASKRTSNLQDSNDTYYFDDDE